MSARRCGQFRMLADQAVMQITLDPADTNAATTDSWVRAVEAAAKYAERHGYQRTKDRSNNAVAAWCLDETDAGFETWRVMLSIEDKV